MNFIDAIVYIANRNLIHGDIKPGNILVSNRDGRLRAFVGDFGLTGKSGGTPIFMAPEGLNKDSRIVGKTDLYSFAVSVLFLMFPVDLALKLLFFPISDDLEIFLQSLYRFPLLELIFKSLTFSKSQEIFMLKSWSIVLEKKKSFDENMLIEKITQENLENKEVILDVLDKAVEKEGGFYFYILELFGYEMDSSKVNKNEAWKMSTAISHMQNISSLYFEQKIGILSKGIIFE